MIPSDHRMVRAMRSGFPIPSCRAMCRAHATRRCSARPSRVGAVRGRGRARGGERARGTMGGCVVCRRPEGHASPHRVTSMQLQLGCTSPITGARIHLRMRHACLMNHPCPSCEALRRAALGVPARWLAGLEHPHVNPLDQTLHHAPASPALVEPGMRAWLREGRRSRQALASVLRKRKKP